MSKTIEFTQNDPIVVGIHQHGDDWAAHPSDENTSKGKTHSQIMQERADRDLPDIDDEWQGRRSGGASYRPAFKSHADHPPIVVREGESVKFMCDRPFVVFVDREPGASPAPNTPNNPFGWQLPRLVENGPVGIPASVLQGENGPAAQRFYKCTMWIFDAGQTITVEADLICDSLQSSTAG